MRKTNYEYQKVFRAKQKAAGAIFVKFWLSPESHEALKDYMAYHAINATQAINRLIEQSYKGVG